VQPQENVTLYNLSDEFTDLEEMLNATGGEINEEWEQKEKFLLELLSKKVDGCCGFIQRQDDLIAAAKGQIARLDNFIKQKNNSIENFKHYVELCMNKLKKESFEGELYEIKKRKASQVLFIKDENAVPVEFTSTSVVTKIDKVGLKKAVQNKTISVDGITLVDGKTSLMFNLKTNKTKKKEKQDATNEQSANA